MEQNKLRYNTFNPYLIVALITSLVIATGCEKTDSDSYTITIGVYSKDSLGNYISTGKELIFNSYEECQTWSRTAPGDIHSPTSHLHYNAAANVSFDSKTTTFYWTEYGPELNQAAIESTCASSSAGVSKSVNNSSYYQDKPNVFLKITSVVEL